MALSNIGHSYEARQVLLIDDDQDVGEILRLECRDLGWNVHTAESGLEAIRMLATIPRPHLILLDLRMPQMSGFEVLRALKASVSTATVPVIILSCTAPKRAVEGAAAVVSKPFHFDGLVRVMEAVCGELN